MFKNSTYSKIRANIGQLPKIRSKFWMELDLGGFPKKGRMPDLLKSGTSLVFLSINV